MFLVDSDAAWPSKYFDAIVGEGEKGQRIAELRSQIRERYLVSFFSQPDDLAKLVSAAVHRSEMNRQMKLESLETDLGFNEPFTRFGPITDSSLMEIKTKISGAEDVQALQINIGSGTDWWSTRLYFLAALAADLTEIRVMVFVDSKDTFVGMATPLIVKERLSQAYTLLRKYERALSRGSSAPADIQGELERRANLWEQEMSKVKGGEESVRGLVTRQELRR